MAIQYGDILLNDSKEIYGTPDGDLAVGYGRVQQIGGIIEAEAGNFRHKPTLTANLTRELDRVSNSREITAKIIDGLRLDGWELEQLSINEVDDTKNIKVEKAVKITDNTESLI